MTVSSPANCAAGFSTLLLNLLTAQEANLDIRVAAFRFDMGLLSNRLEKATAWLAQQPATKSVPIGYFGIGYGACAVLVTAAKRPDLVHAVVSHDAMPELTEDALSWLTVPTLLISGPNQAHYEEFGAKEVSSSLFPVIITTRKKWLNWPRPGSNLILERHERKRLKLFFLQALTLLARRTQAFSLIVTVFISV